MSILGLLFFIIIIILVLGLSVISSVLRAIFGFGKRRNPGTGQSQTNSQTNNRSSSSTVNNPGKKREKYFDKNEGEYVEFEEVDDTGKE